MSSQPLPAAVMVSFRGRSAPGWVLTGIESGLIPSVCLFNYNFTGPAGLRELTDSLRAAAERGGQLPPLIGIDQEGGQLMAVSSGTTELPGNMALGATRSEELAGQAGRILATELRALGCNLNFAPVLDVIGDLDSQVVGVRAFSDDPQLVARLGTALVHGLQDNGVLATAKHFPGHGRTSLDSHVQAPVIDVDRAALERDLRPFRAAIAAGVGAMMSAHISYPQLDSEPATLSRELLTRLLREELGFEGLVITDAMDMQAVRHLQPEVAVTRAVAAGADLVLLGHLENQEQLVEAIAAVTPPEVRERIQEARERYKADPLPFDMVGAGPHRDAAQTMADRAVTVVRGEPFLQIAPSDRLCLVTFRRAPGTVADSTSGSELLLVQSILSRHDATRELVVSAEQTATDLAEQVIRQGARSVVIATEGAAGDPRQDELIARLSTAGIQPVVIALKHPVDARILTSARHVACTYGSRAPQVEAAARLLFGELKATGQLPVTLDPSGTVAA